MHRYLRFAELSDIESAIANLQKSEALLDDAHPEKPGFLANYAESQLTRYTRLGEVINLQDANANMQRAILLAEHRPNADWYSNLACVQLV